MIGRGVAAQGRDDAKRYAEHDCHQHGRDSELDRCGQAGEQVLGDRPRREQAGAQVAAQKLAVVVHELNRERSVEAELGAQGLDLRFARRLAREQRHGVGGNDA